MFTHLSLDDYRVVVSDMAGGTRTTTGRLVPYAVFIEPETGIAYRLAKLPMQAVPRARTLSEQSGFMKALVAFDTDAILGFAMLGAQAGEVMAVVQMAMPGGLPYTALRDAILTHPAVAEGLGLLFAKLQPTPIAAAA